jgi:hypothetical protein
MHILEYWLGQNEEALPPPHPGCSRSPSQPIGSLQNSLDSLGGQQLYAADNENTLDWKLPDKTIGCGDKYCT